MADEELIGALRHGSSEHQEYRSTIDDLFRASQIFRQSDAFGDAIKFMAKFRNYSPFNNLLVLTQKPECRFFATQRDWQKRFGRQINPDSRPLVILAPMHPVMLVYDLEDTDGDPIPDEFDRFGQAEGEFDPKILERTIGNAWRRDRIEVEFRRLDQLSAGWVRRRLDDPGFIGDEHPELTVTIREQMDEPSRYLTLCHELAHVYLGHLGPSDRGSRWPCRANLSYANVEIEAEAVACIVCERQGLSTTSDMYLANFLKRPEIPNEVGMELIAKAADRILNMGKRKMPDRGGDGTTTGSVYS